VSIIDKPSTQLQSLSAVDTAEMAETAGDTTSSEVATTFGSPSVQLDFDSDGKIHISHKATEPTDEDAIRRAKLVSALSIAISIVVGVSGIGIGIGGGALAIVGLAGETLLDAVSSVMVIWRYKKPKLRPNETEEQARVRLHARAVDRERRFTLIIGIGFVLFAVLLLPISVSHLNHRWKRESIEEKDADYSFVVSIPAHLNHRWKRESIEEKAADYSFVVSIPACVSFISLAFVKFKLAIELESKTMRQDAICTIFGAALALITGMASLLEHALASKGDDKDAFGIVDPIVSMIIATLILGEGLRTVYHNSLFFQAHEHFTESRSLV